MASSFTLMFSYEVVVSSETLSLKKDLYLRWKHHDEKTRQGKSETKRPP